MLSKVKLVDTPTLAIARRDGFSEAEDLFRRARPRRCYRVLIVRDFKLMRPKVTPEGLDNENDGKNGDEWRGVSELFRILQLLNSCPNFSLSFA